jgi:putative MATE family efflux protein
MNKTKSKSRSVKSMTEGNVMYLLLAFSLPIFIGNLFQQLYNVVDTVVIGHFLGDEALAAVGSTSAIYSLLIGFTYGLSNGFSVVLARLFGADDEDSLHRTVGMSALISVVFAAFLTGASLLFMRPLLVSLKTPESIIEMSADYLLIIMGMSTVTMLYNTLSGFLRALGNSRLPLYALILASAVNVVLDILFVGYMDMGVKGAAYATVIAQAISAGMELYYIAKACPILHIRREYLRPDRRMIAELLSTGISMAMMLVLTNIGTVAMQSAVNGLGVVTITGHTAARKIHDILILPLGTICTSAATFVSQNYGAKKMDRVKMGIKSSMLLGMMWCVVAVGICLLFGRAMVYALTGTQNAEVADTTMRYLLINVPFYFVLNVLLVLRNSLQGMGRKIVPLAASFTELAGKFIAAFIMAPMLGYLGVCLIEPITWIATAMIVAGGFISAYRKENADSCVTWLNNLSKIKYAINKGFVAN